MKKRVLIFALSIIMLLQSVPANATTIENSNDNIGDRVEESMQNIDLTSYTDVINGFCDLSQDYYEFEYKIWLEDLQKELPSQLQAYSNESGDIISVDVLRWECLQDYDKPLGTYEFQPSFNEEIYSKLSENVLFPTICVHFTTETSDGMICELDEPQNIIVPDVDWSAIQDVYALYDKASSADSYYNQYTDGVLPAVRNQNPYGTCWAHAAIGTTEISMTKKNLRNKNLINYSEWHVAYFSNFKYDDPKDCHDNDYTVGSSDYLSTGGDSLTAIRLMGIGVGPVDEGEYPDLAYKNAKAGVEIDEKYAIGYSDALVTNYYVINSANKTDVKKAIIDYGAVTASYLHSDKYYSSTNNSYYCPDDYVTNHAVTLVGWDDNFSKDLFPGTNKPENNGAWLVRNSWGSNGYSMYGYFWISYEDCTLDNRGFFIAVEADEPYQNVYAYDGQCQALYSGKSLSYRSCNSGAVLSQTFHVSQDETVKAVSIEIVSANVKCEVEVTDGIHTSTGTVNTSYSGMYTIILDKPIAVVTDSDIAVQYKLTSNIDESYICFGYEASYGTENIASHDSDFKINGSLQNYDARIHLYTDNSSFVKKNIELVNKTIDAHAYEKIQLELTDEAEVQISELTWSSKDEEVATVDSKGMISMGVKKGSTVIYGVYETTGQKVTCCVTVLPYNIEYVLGDDTYNLISDDAYYYYPGDADNCSLPSTGTGTLFYSAYRAGYYLAGWCYDSELKDLATKDNLVEHTGNIKLYPKWNEKTLTICFHDFTEDLSSYDSTNWTLKDVTPSILPYDGSNLVDIYSGYYTNFYKYNSQLITNGQEPLTIKYFSYDAEGEKVVTSITIDEYGIENQYSAYYYQKKILTLYPQYKEMNLPRVDSVSLVEGGSLGICFYLDVNRLSEEVINNASLDIGAGTEKTSIKLAYLPTVSVDGKNLKRLLMYLPAKNISDLITIKILDDSGEAYHFNNKGLVDDTEFTYSICKAAKDYKNMYSDSTDFAESLVGYGAASGLLFGTKNSTEFYEMIVEIAGSDEEANSYLSKRKTVNKDTLVQYSREKLGTVQTPEGLNYIGSSLVLEDCTAIRHYFTIDSDKSINDYSFDVVSGESKVSKTPILTENVYYIEIRGISSVLYDKIYTLVINDEYEIKYSVNTYLYTAIEKERNTELLDLVKGMYLYGYESRKKFSR